ncbi:MAG: pyridoxamine 5'-phosphate oxidase family protein [Calditrichae bacterium]|nr:pyridoxamine 5'-phosphate oxidase family protein [Calditrichia bacterium]
MGEYQHESWDSFDEILQKCFGMLETGVSDRHDPLHTPVIGTVENNAPQLRTVIFRKFDPASRTLIFHTDFRTEKVAQIQNNPVVSWLFYHPERKVQLRIISDAKIHSDDSIADERWAASQLMSRRCYCIPMAPGTLSDSPESGLPEYLQLRRPTESESNDLGRANFCAISCQIREMDWLYLAAKGNRRAKFEWKNEHLHATWLIP